MVFSKDELLRRIVLFNEGPTACLHYSSEKGCRLNVYEKNACYNCPRFALNSVQLSKDYSYEMMGVRLNKKGA